MVSRRILKLFFLRVHYQECLHYKVVNVFNIHEHKIMKKVNTRAAEVKTKRNSWLICFLYSLSSLVVLLSFRRQGNASGFCYVETKAKTGSKFIRRIMISADGNKVTEY